MASDLQIYVADLAAYNSGFLHGIWIDACEDLDSIWKAIRKLLEASPVDDAEEYAIHDYEGFGSYSISEYTSIKEVHAAACFIGEHGDLGAEMLAYFDDLSEARSALEERYHGCYASLTEFARSITEETTEIPEHLAAYIDYFAIGGDMILSGEIVTIETAHDEVHVFWSS